MTSVVVARYEFPEGGQVSCTVQVHHSYPDALDEARAQAVRGLREAMAALADVDEDDG